MDPKSRIGLAGIIGLGGATALAIGTGGAALPLLILSSTGLTMKAISLDPDYEPTYKNELNLSNIPKNIGHSLNKLLDEDNKRSQYISELRYGSNIINQHLENLPKEKYENISKIKIFPEARKKIFGLPIGKKSLEIGVKYG